MENFAPQITHASQGLHKRAFRPPARPCDLPSVRPTWPKTQRAAKHLMYHGANLNLWPSIMFNGHRKCCVATPALGVHMRIYDTFNDVASKGNHWEACDQLNPCAFLGGRTLAQPSSRGTSLKIPRQCQCVDVKHSGDERYVSCWLHVAVHVLLNGQT